MVIQLRGGQIIVLSSRGAHACWSAKPGIFFGRAAFVYWAADPLGGDMRPTTGPDRRKKRAGSPRDKWPTGAGGTKRNVADATGESRARRGSWIP